MSTLITEPRFSETTATDPKIHQILETILNGQRSGVLGTCFMEIPLCSQMAFVATEDLRNLIVVTPRQSTKYDNMMSNPNVSFLVTTVSNRPEDISQAQAVTATAFATELDGERRHEAVTLYSAKHPDLRAFAMSSANAVMELRVDTFALVHNFQEVVHITQG
jgi:nitroimidazol reductase NimA-like FMN-containing flavoprotein (pyridoxamine 5'-phosphate oxidase superfamily)